MIPTCTECPSQDWSRVVTITDQQADFIGPDGIHPAIPSGEPTIDYGPWYCDNGHLYQGTDTDLNALLHQ